MFKFLRFIAGALSLALLISLANCRRDPHITSFTVVPQNACPNEVVQATWTTTSDFVRLATSSGSEAGPTGANSSLGVTVIGDTVFTLSAHIDDRSITESRRVTVRSPLEFPEVISVVCEGSTPRFRTIIYEPAQYSSRFKAASIRNRSMQPVTVEHLIIHRTLAPGEEVTERDFGTVDFIGEWRITTAVPVNACQQPGTGGGPPPPQLPPPSEVTLVATCR